MIKMIFGKRVYVLCLIISLSIPGLHGQEIRKATRFENSSKVISLAGEWNFRLDPEDLGIGKEWYSMTLDDKVVLPGTTDENKKGIFKDERRDDRLSRIWYWVGAAWYQRQVTIPDNWQDQRITLFLGRTKDVTVWVDTTYCGHGSSLSAPHTYDLTDALSPGKHTITILVDNSKLPPVGPAHAVDERTQTNWNGIVGKIELRASDKLYIEEVQVYPDIKNNRATVNVNVGNITKWGGNADIILQARTINSEDQVIFEEKIWPVFINGRNSWHKIQYEFNKAFPLWDEFDPALLELTITVQSQPGKDWLRNTDSVVFGMRSFTSGGTGFKINGKGTFLRGTQDACIFPLTGYAPMDKEEWLRLFGIAKSYGINHYRFHSWCPPEAAFEAADEIGMYLQPELPNKADYGKPEHDIYLRKEGELIFQAYGNHPSFVMLTLGNELGRNPAYYDMISHFKEIDTRHLYAQGSNNENYPGGDLTLAEGDDFWVTSQTGEELPVRGSFYQGDYKKGHIDFLPPSTMVNYDKSIAGLPVPVVAHEIGQFQVSPDFSEIPEYTGVLKARNYEIFRDRLKEKNMLDQAADFVKASGALSVICYREEIEAALRTKWFGGFQLLDLHDFSGQGTAPVGILNVFMESKGLIEPSTWREFCSEIVPLLKMKKYTWENTETFTGAIEISHFGPDDVKQGIVDWKVNSGKGKTLFSGSTEPEDIEQGGLHDIDMFAFPLAEVEVPQKLTIELSLRGTKYMNHYNIWVYKKDIDISVPDNVKVARLFDENVRKYLMDGGKVILIPEKNTLVNSVKGAFQTDFWCFPMFRRAALRNNVEVAPGTLGILCDPEHKALADFPTEFHSDWQWWQLVKNSNPVILDNTEAEYRPVIQVIDNFWRNHKLGILFETKVGKGKLLICSIDLLNNLEQPEVRQFYHSLLNYVGSSNFKPSAELGIESLIQILKTDIYQ